jgi:hypothetical protein
MTRAAPVAAPSRSIERVTRAQIAQQREYERDDPCDRQGEPGAEEERNGARGRGGYAVHHSTPLNEMRRSRRRVPRSENRAFVDEGPGQARPLHSTLPGG